MKRFLKLIRRWLDLSDNIPWEKESPEWEDTAPSEYEPPHEEPPRPEEEIADWFDESDDIEATKTLHQELYELATKNGTTINMGGSENASGI